MGLRRIIKSWIADAVSEQYYGFNKRGRPMEIEQMAYMIATYESAKFFMHKMPLAENHVDKTSLLYYAISQAKMDGMVLEFGVAGGKTITRIAGAVKQTVFGFDSFEGLPEDWTHFQRQGRFSTSGEFPPNLPDNVALVKGWFNESLPVFVDNHPDDIKFLHIDCDLYSSAKTVLCSLANQIKPGTVILFDEYFNYPGWQEHEFKAFNEFIEEYNVSFEYIGFASQHFSVAVVITEPGG
jgi:hypothetical protein